MQYQVSRNGQLYGPYTIEELQRYVASGHVLLSDLAKSADMPDWVPVSQVLGGGAGLPPQPVAAAGYSVIPPAYPAVAYPDPPNLNWVLALLLGFFTCGLFFVVWDLVIAAWAKRVQPRSQALMYYIIATVLVVLNFGSSYGVFIALSQHHAVHRSIAGNLLGIITWVIRLVARFTLRDTLEQHFNGPEPLGLRLNPVMTFFFGGLYFTYKLNEMTNRKQALRYGNMPR